LQPAASLAELSAFLFSGAAMFLVGAEWRADLNTMFGTGEYRQGPKGNRLRITPRRFRRGRWRHGQPSGKQRFKLLPA
jgi:hypothetical protein